MTLTVEQIAEISRSAIDSQIEDKPIAIIYPRHKARSALVAMFLQKFGANLYYYALTPDDDGLKNWLRNIAQCETFPAEFGSQILQAVETKAAPEDLAAAFGAGLASLKAQRSALVLEAFDNLKMTKDVERFVRALAPAIPAGIQLVLNARLINLQPWDDLVRQGYAAVIGNDEAMGGGIFNDPKQRGQLEVYALSGGHVYIDGQPITSWDGSLPRHLFYYFVDHPMVTRDEIFEVFWPKMSVKEATNVFHVTKRKISERLGYELTNYQSGFYIPSPQIVVHYDASLFDGHIQQAMEDEDNAHIEWHQAIRLYRSDYLPYIDMPWIETRRAQLKNRYAQALIGLGRYHRKQGEMDQALGYLQRALREKPDWEDVHRDIMMIYYQQGERDQAVEQYNQLVQTLDDMFGIRPTVATRELFDVVAAI